MTIPEYDKECDCDLCKQIRNDRDIANKQRIKKEIEDVLKTRKVSTGTDFQEDNFR